jgi:TrmH family RNA methyltransferase
MTIITGRDNQKLKFARGVRDGREPGYIFLEGVRLAEEALRSGVEIVEILVNESFWAKDELSELQQNAVVVADRLFDSITETKSSQGLVIIAKKPVTSLEAVSRAVADTSGIPVTVFLSEINNPSNLGAILRTAEAAGVRGLVISRNSADAFSPKALRAAMGASLRIPIYENAGFDEMLEWAAAHRLVTTAADISGEVNYSEADWTEPRLLIFGSESHGLRDEEKGKVRELVRIPMENEVESLNLAVSCGIILFEAKRQAVSQKQPT